MRFTGKVDKANQIDLSPCRQFSVRAHQIVSGIDTAIVVVVSRKGISPQYFARRYVKDVERAALHHGDIGDPVAELAEVSVHLTAALRSKGDERVLGIDLVE